MKRDDDTTISSLVEARGAGPELLLHSHATQPGKIREKFSGNTDRAHSTDSPCSFHCPTTVSASPGTLTRHHPCHPHNRKVTDVRRKTRTGNGRAASAWTKMAGRGPADWRDGDGRGVVSARHVPCDRSTIKIKIRGGEVGMESGGGSKRNRGGRGEEKGERECTQGARCIRYEGSNVPLAG